MIDGVFPVGADVQKSFAEAGALTREDCAAVQRQLRARSQHELQGEGEMRRYLDDRLAGKKARRPPARKRARSEDLEHVVDGGARLAPADPHTDNSVHPVVFPGRSLEDDAGA